MAGYTGTLQLKMISAKFNIQVPYRAVLRPAAIVNTLLVCCPDFKNSNNRAIKNFTVTLIPVSG